MHANIKINQLFLLIVQYRVIVQWDDKTVFRYSELVHQNFCFYFYVFVFMWTSAKLDLLLA